MDNIKIVLNSWFGLFNKKGENIINEPLDHQNV